MNHVLKMILLECMKIPINDTLHSLIIDGLKSKGYKDEAKRANRELYRLKNT